MVDNVKVAPSEEATAVPVATDEVGGVHYPIYKISYGDLGSQTPVTSTNRLPVETVASNGIPQGFTKMTSNTIRKYIAKGQLNKVGVFPRIGNEHVESSASVQSVLTSTNIVGQIFRASKDNISALMLTLESAAGIVIDDFEGYANNAALQAVWSATGVLATLDTVIFQGGAQAMRLLTTNVADEWSRSSAPIDYTDYTGTFGAYFTHSSAQQQIEVFIGDSIGNTKSLTLAQDGAGLWCNCEVNENAMTEDQGPITNITDIVTIGYRVITKAVGGYVVIDDLQSVPPAGEVEVKLWDMGATLPVSGITKINDGTQYQKLGDAEAASYRINLLGGKRLYHIEEFTAGVDKTLPTNELLTVDNYYILELKYVDTNINVYGADPTVSVNNYQSGFAFTASDESTTINSIGQYNDLMFGIMSRQQVYITGTAWHLDSSPNGAAEISVFTEDSTNKVTDVVIDHENSPEQVAHYDVSLRPMLLDDGGKLEYYYNDDYSDNVTAINVHMTFAYEPPTVHG